MLYPSVKPYLDEDGEQHLFFSISPKMAFTDTLSTIVKGDRMPTKSTCGGCRLVFASLGAFDAHRVGSFGEPMYQVSRSGLSQHVIGHAPSSRRCLTVREIEAPHPLG